MPALEALIVRYNECLRRPSLLRYGYRIVANLSLELRYIGGEILSQGVTSMMLYFPPVALSGAVDYAEPATLHSGTIRQAVLRQPIEHIGGIVRVPDGPRLGVEVDREALAKLASISTGDRSGAPCLIKMGRDCLANSLLSAIAVSDIMSIGRHGCINPGRHEPLGSTTR